MSKDFYSTNLGSSISWKRLFKSETASKKKWLQTLKISDSIISPFKQFRTQPNTTRARSQKQQQKRMLKICNQQLLASAKSNADWYDVLFHNHTPKIDSRF